MAEHIQPMIDGDHHDIAALTQTRAVIQRTRPRAAAELAAVKPNHHRSLAAVLQCRRPDVENQTILSHLFARTGLRTRWAITQRIACLLPSNGRLRRQEARVSSVRAIRNAFEDMHTLRFDA